MQTFGERIRELRKDRGLTLIQLAADLSMDSANLSKIETGKREFDGKRIPDLCKIFNLKQKDIQQEFLSEKFAKKVYEAKLDSSIFLLAERKVKFFIERNIIETELNF